MRHRPNERLSIIVYSSTGIPEGNTKHSFPLLHSLSHRASARRVYSLHTFQWNHPAIRSLFLIFGYRRDDREA